MRTQRFGSSGDNLPVHGQGRCRAGLQGCARFLLVGSLQFRAWSQARVKASASVVPSVVGASVAALSLRPDCRRRLQFSAKSHALSLISCSPWMQVVNGSSANSGCASFSCMRFRRSRYCSCHLPAVATALCSRMQPARPLEGPSCCSRALRQRAGPCMLIGTALWVHAHRLRRHCRQPEGEDGHGTELRCAPVLYGGGDVAGVVSLSVAAA